MNDKLKLRQVTSDDEDLLFSWANDPEVRNQAINQKKINIDEHKKWLNQRLNDPNTKMLILEVSGVAAGQIRWECRSGVAFLDYSIDPDFKRKGFGKQLLRQGIQAVLLEWPDITLKAEVLKENNASIHTLLDSGFHECQAGGGGGRRFGVESSPIQDHG
jgi:RimJ/RimL family protein N-acetyltransferase